MTKQEIFDKVTNHLLNQNKRSLQFSNSLLVCAYRGADNTMCAIGCLIPDELYDPIMESRPITYILNEIDNPVFNPIQQLFRNIDIAFLRSLEIIHDVNPVHHWKDELKKFSDRYNLEFNF